MIIQKARSSVQALLAKSILVAAIALAPLAAKAEELRFILAHPLPQGHIFDEVSKAFIGKLDELSNGEMKVQYHPGGDLGGVESLFDQAMKGTLPMILTWPLGSFDRRLDVSYIGYIVDNWEDAERLWGPGGLMIDIYNDIYNDLGIASLGSIPTGFGGISVRKGDGRVPVNYPEDANGVKLRIPALPLAEVKYSALGFAPVPIPQPEIYTALQLGTVDMRAFATITEAYQMRDVIETYVWTKDYFEQAGWYVSKPWWDRLTEDQRSKITEAVDFALSGSWQLIQDLEADVAKKAEADGMKVVTLDEEQIAKAVAILREVEWPYMEEIVGSETMNKIRAAAGQ